MTQRSPTIRTEDFQTGGKFEPAWLLIDAKGQTLGRLASQIAMILRGKHKPTFTPHADTGDFVIVINAGEVKLTGNKRKDKFYFHHTVYPGGVKQVQAEKLLERKPTEVLRLAVKRMLPKNALNRAILGKLKIYSGAEHPHAAQKPKPFTVPYPG
jgi:large subunit ribosomal protein L13